MLNLVFTVHVYKNTGFGFIFSDLKTRPVNNVSVDLIGLNGSRDAISGRHLRQL